MSLRDRLLLGLTAALGVPSPAAPSTPRMDSFLGTAASSASGAQATAQGFGGGFGRFFNPLTGMGTGRDKATSTRFGVAVQMMEAEATDLYRGEGLAARVIDLPVRESLRQGYTVDFEGSSEADTDGWEADLIIDREGGRGLGTALRRLLTWRDIYGGSALYLICADGRRAWEPLDEDSPRLVGLRVLSRWDLQPPLIWDPDPTSPYEARLWGVRASALRIHPSRLIALGRGSLPSSTPQDTDGWDDSVYVRLWQALAANGTLDQSAVSIVNNFVTPVQKITGLRESLASNGMKLLERMGLQQLVRGQHNITLLDENESFQYLTTSISGLPELLDRFPQRVSAITGIPLTLLMGMSPAGLNATGASDVRFFYDNVVAKYQTDLLYDVIRRVYALAFKSPSGPTQGRAPEKFRLTFAPLYQQTELEKADIALRNAQRDQIYMASGVITADQVRQSRFGQDEGDIDLEPTPAPVPRLVT